jgi:hypothetical protein
MKTNSSGKSKPSQKWTLRLALCSAGLLVALVTSAPGARAGQNPDQNYDQTSDQGDPPSRAARISYVEGSVSLQPGGDGDWGAAAKNRPTTVGDKIWSDKDSRAELQAGQASIHMGSMTALSFLNLDDNIMQVRVAEGAINFRVRELREGDAYEIDTPNAAFMVKQAGAFRVEVSEDGEGTRVTAIRGEGEITAGGKTYEVHAGEMAELNGTDNPEYRSSQAAPPDGLDRWAAQRDLREDNSTSARYVSRDMPGYSDLDDNGTWNEEPDYGPVWYPSTVSAGWAPYSYGYWNWIGPWGWSWIGYEPWGFAPYHYGRWSYIHNRWGWCPGPIYARPFYGPAFVGFFGGAHFGVGLNVGWFPLGFGEPCHPWWHGGRGYVERINVRNTVIRNTTIIHNTNYNYVNARNVNAVTVASHGAFVNGQAINRNSIRVTPDTLRGARVSNNLGFTPTRTSNFGAANARARVATPPASVQNRTVVARTTPGAAASRQSVRAINTTRLTPGRPSTGATNYNNRLGSTTVNSARPGVANNNRPGVASNTVNNSVNNRVNSGANNAATARQNELARSRPPSAGGFGNNPGNNTRTAIGRTNTTNSGVGANANAGRSSTARTWEAQGNSTDRGSAPRGFGSDRVNSPNGGAGYGNGSSQGARYSRSDRPAWAGSGTKGNASVSGNANGSRSTNPPSYNNRPSYSNNNRSYQPPARSYSNDSRAYQAPSRSYSSPRSSYPSSRPSYSAPAPRSYSAPSRSYSAPPSHGSGGGNVSHGSSSSGGGSRGSSSSRGGSRSH